jgi:anti-sigma B factor antagonist
MKPKEIVSMNAHGTAGLHAGTAAGETNAKLAFSVSPRKLDAHTAVLSVEGDLDLASAPSLKWALADAVGAGATQLVIDLAQVSFIDSTALGVLVGAHRSLDRGTRMAITCSRPEVLNIFELTGLDSTFDIFGDLDSALAHVRDDAVAAD